MNNTPFSSEDFLAYNSLYDTPENADFLIHCFWDISAFPEPDFILFKTLQDVSGADFDNDYRLFLKGDNLYKTGLRIAGLESSQNLAVALQNTKEPSERVIKTANLLPPDLPDHLLEINEKMEKRFPNGKFFRAMLAETLVLLFLSKEHLRQWSKAFSPLLETHPAPDESIRNVLSSTMRGEALIVDGNFNTHRNFNDSAECFVMLMEGKLRSENIWKEKRKRIWNAMGETTCEQ